MYYITGLITDFFFFSNWAAFFRPCYCDLQGCLTHWSSQPSPSACHLSTLHPTCAKRSLSLMGRRGEMPRPWEGSLTGHPTSCPCLLLLGFCPQFHLTCAGSLSMAVISSLSPKSLSHSQIQVCTADPAACFCCHCSSCRGWENTCMQSCKLLTVHLSFLVNKKNILLIAHSFKRGILSRWTKATKREYH